MRALVLVVVLLLASSCRSAAPTETTADDPGAVTPVPTATSAPGDPPDTETESESGTGFNDPSAGPDRAPDEPRIVPPLVLPSTAPGTDEAANALIEELDRFILPDERAEGVPWPDLRNPDPVDVYMSSADFQQWMSSTNPTPTLVEAYTAPNSPERGFDLDIFDERNNLGLRSGPGDPPYSMRVADVVHPAATGINDTLLARVPEGSVAIVYWDSIGPRDNFTADGQYWGTVDGWTDLGPWLAIMAPTDVGWQVWWDELEEPPPPGSREQQGSPSEENSRVDV